MKDLIVRCLSCNVENGSSGRVEAELKGIYTIDGLDLKELYDDRYFDESDILKIIPQKTLLEEIDIDDFIDHFGVDKILEQIESAVIERYIRKKKIEEIERK
jgi:hypothetical protein